MKYITIIISFLFTIQLQAQSLERVISLRGDWKFSIGNNSEWSERGYDDSHWEEIYVPENWENEGFNGFDGYAWYRRTIDGARLQDDKDYYIVAGYIDDADKTYFNGELIGKSGNFPPGFRTAFRAKREYLIPGHLIRKGENVIAIQVYDRYGEGGIVSGKVGIYALERAALEVDLRGIWKLKSGDNREWKDTYYDDANWKPVYVPSPWEKQDFPDMDGVAWYRREFHLDAQQSKQDWMIILGRIDDFDKTYVNGQFIGETADFKRYGLSTSYSKIRAYELPAGLTRNGMNVIAIRVVDLGNVGGIYDGPVGLILKSQFDPDNLPSFDYWDYKYR